MSEPLAIDYSRLIIELPSGWARERVAAFVETAVGALSPLLVEEQVSSLTAEQRTNMLVTGEVAFGVSLGSKLLTIIRQGKTLLSGSARRAKKPQRLDRLIAQAEKAGKTVTSATRTPDGTTKLDFRSELTDANNPWLTDLRKKK